VDVARTKTHRKRNPSMGRFSKIGAFYFDGRESGSCTSGEANSRSRNRSAFKDPTDCATGVSRLASSSSLSSSLAFMPALSINAILR
jgi:hypothetical protein